jgi:hypothetical protein
MPLGLVEKLAARVPPPRANQVIYSGVLAGNAALRPEVVWADSVDRAAAQRREAGLRGGRRRV